ncbi:MAG TPA: helix-turn-helix transcriptional regulator [Micromonosporaceae bacterium]|nr:helix-turn-helix transcriptional regulator [Micromonosporaceae bacterium]
MAVGSPPTMRRRQLGRELRRLREGAGLHLEQLADQLRCSPSRLSRIETARIRISPGTVHEILDVLGITDPRRDRLVSLAREAAEPGWWHPYADALSYEYATYLAMESEAVSLRSYQPLVVHGLLQTEAYAQAVIGKRLKDQAERAAKIGARMRRQDALTRADPLGLRLVLGEAALRRPVGGAQVMREQLHRLLEAGELANVQIHVSPFATGEITSMHGPFSILDFLDRTDPSVVYLEHVVGEVYTESPEIVAECAAVFESLVADALTADESREFIDRLAHEAGQG